jgi:hypothetical protein
MHCKPQETIETEVALTYAIVPAMRVPIERLDQRDGELCYGFRGVGGYPGDEEVEPVCGFEVDVVEACTAEQDGSRSAFVESFKNAGIQMVIDEGADCVASLGEGGCVLGEQEDVIG